jgi:hypothetical protein
MAEKKITPKEPVSASKVKAEDESKAAARVSKKTMKKQLKRTLAK